jgi:sterol desaturase/sphingolipid hydroxylase (fatty acid hydroxylase superfamily)
MTATVCCQAGRENPTAGRLTAASRKGMELLTTEHGKAGYLADFIVYAMASTALAVLLAIVVSYVRRTELLTFALLGLSAWTLVEMVYVIVHHATHHWRAETAWLRRIKRHHALHHSPVPAASRYGVTSALWDVVFRTNGTPLPHATS